MKHIKENHGFLCDIEITQENIDLPDKTQVTG